MKIQDVGLKHPPFDVATPQAEYMISTGQFVKYSDPFAPVRQPSVITFGLLESPDPFTPPAITHSCSGCTLTGYTSSAKGTAHKAVIQHCGQNSLPGPEVAEAYVKAFKAFSRSKDEPQPAQPKKIFFANVGR
jgi:hypothetical protein